MYPLINISARSGEIPLEEATFKTEFNGAVTFALSKTGAAVNWDMGDGTTYIGVNTVNHVYADGTEKTVTIYADDLTLITEFGDLSNKDITEINFQNLDGLGGQFEIQSNSGLTDLNMPTASTNPFTRIWYYDCDITGAFSLSGCILQGDLRGYNNSNLTSINHSTNATQFSTTYRVNGCNITGIHLMQGVRVTIGSFWIHSNSNLEGITHNASMLQDSVDYRAYVCDITGSHDVSMIEVKGQFRIHQNANLTAISHKATSTPFSAYTAYSTGITSLDVSMITQLGGAVWIYSCPSLTSLTFPVASSASASFILNNLDSLATIDLSGFSNINQIQVDNNDVLTSFTPPVSTSTFTSLSIDENPLINAFDITTLSNYINIDNQNSDLSDNNWSVAETNQMLVYLDTIATGVNTGRTITITNNSIPDGSTGGNDGLTAKANLIGKGIATSTDV